MELLERFVDRTDREIYALVRADSDAAAQKRVEEALALVAPERTASGRVTAIAADIEHEGLGLDDARRAELARSVSTIVHSAASVSFTLSLEDARGINVEGTRRMLEFADETAAAGRLDRFAYVSTAYVAGDHAGAFHEDELDVDQSFRNTYEQTKHEAEAVVREHTDRLPIQIFRPSIVVGEMRSGWTASFNVLYAPLKAFVRGALPFLPADRGAPVDVVPVDYVADAIFAITSEALDRSGETFHLVSGRDATTVGGFAEEAARQLDRDPPRIVPPHLYRRLVHPVLKRVGNPRRREGMRRNEVFFPYFTMKVRFDNANARKRLAGSGLAAPPVERYLDRLLEFANRAEWGRRRPPRRAGTR